MAVRLAACPGNPAQAILAPSSLLNLPLETTARSLSAMPSSLGMGPERAHAHLLVWAGKISELIGGPWLGAVSEQNGPRSTFHQAVLASPRGALALSLPKPGPLCPSKTLIFLPNWLKTLAHSPITQLIKCFCAI